MITEGEFSDLNWVIMQIMVNMVTVNMMMVIIYGGDPA